MLDDSEWSRIARYFAGECSAAESEATREWIAADPERQQLAATTRAAWDGAATPGTEWNTDAAWRRLTPRQRRAPSVRARRWHQPAGLRWPAGLVAAALLVGAGLTIARRIPQQAAQSVSEVTPAEREYRTGAGHRTVIVLLDGTRVDLDVESTLRVRIPGPGARSGTPRELFLEGEALFTVVSDSTHPLIVHARNAVTEDIGTTFGVRAYPADSWVRVVVVKGEVSLRMANAPAHSGTLLEARDMGQLDAAGRTRVARGISTDDYLGWSRDRFVFHSAPLREVTRHFERWYGVRIEIADAAVAGELVTMNIPAGALSDALTAATVPLALGFSRQGGTIMIRKQ